MKLAVVALLLGACVAEDATDLDERPADVQLELLEEDDGNAQVCAAAAELPASDICSLVCDPDAFKARLLDDGMKAGNCYQVRCTLAPEMSVTVGVCLI